MSGQEASALELRTLLQGILEKQCGCIAAVSYQVCLDVIVHHESDLERLLKIHPNGVHPSKHIGYLVFWIRKLKPISNAYSIHAALAAKNNSSDQSLRPDQERATINEVVSIYMAQHLMLSYAQDGLLVKDIAPDRTDDLVDRITQVLHRVLTLTIDVGHGHGNLFESFLYDMRYRTFGPHHVVHFVNHVVYAARSSLLGA